ncbi:indolepyruvate oxidoreductase subunit beta [Thermophilibacter sp. ET337]|uniref:indolepyruvate oxidoreductase subunit beta n=1 Tax=Thermophilibacter sp. ET337 TaxID=2973084 RepID=UPI0021AD4941|nr:indolepyruvate oxidoreductase subunit beta [Thermophilibacter sp. ET337]MCR8908567.1 indolepyruvate oxidoreductase subunit beta [Thermophilibacter sp. ET337]
MSENARSTDIILAGVGGQGAVLASKLLARAAMERGLSVKTAETIGMAQRGGSVFSHVRLGEGAVSPLIGRGRADAIVAFEPAEAVRQLPFLRAGGVVVTSDAPVIPVSAATGGPAYDLPAIMSYLRERVGEKNLAVVDAAAAEAALGTARALNVVLLGAAARAGALGPVTADDLAAAVRATVSPRFLDLDLRALSIGPANWGQSPNSSKLGTVPN